MPNAVRLFRCDLCSKDYSRQPDYEAHLRSYDHTHRTRMADLKRLTAQNEDKQRGSGKDKGDLRTVDTGTSGPKFTKIATSGEGGSRFRKVGTAVGVETKSGFTKVGGPSAPADTSAHVSVEAKGEKLHEDKLKVKVEDEVNDVVMGGTKVEGEEDGLKQEEEEYDFTKPTGYDDATEMKEEEEEEEEEEEYEEYDFTKPTGCDHATCPGCQLASASTRP